MTSRPKTTITPMESHVFVVFIFHGAEFDRMLNQSAYSTREAAEEFGAKLRDEYRALEEPMFRESIRAEIHPVPFIG